MATNRQLLREMAAEQYGYVTTRDAAAADIPAVELRKLAARGALTNVGYGVYRVADARPDERDQFAEALLLVGPDAYLTHDAVLALHHLALVNPRKLRVGTPHRTRGHLPAYIEVLRRQLPPEDLTVYDGLRCTTVARALIDCRGLVMTERLREAAAEATKQGLLTRRERAAVMRALRAGTRTPQAV